MLRLLFAAWMLVDWYGLAERVELYAALISDAPSRDVSLDLARAAELDSRIEPAAQAWLRSMASTSAEVILLCPGAEPGATRVDLYSALLVDAPSEAAELAILRAARLDPRIAPAGWRWLHGIARENNRDRPDAPK